MWVTKSIFSITLLFFLVASVSHATIASEEAWKIQTNTKRLEFGENLIGTSNYDTIASITNSQFVDDTEMPGLLRSPAVQNKHGVHAYEQRMYFEDNNTEYVFFGNGGRGGEDLFFAQEGQQLARYELEFNKIFSSDRYISDGRRDGNGKFLKDYVGILYEILGKNYLLTEAEIVGSNGLHLTFGGDGFEHHMTLGQTDEIEINQNLYEITVDFIDHSVAKLTINGEETELLSENGYQVLEDGVALTIRKIHFQNFAGGVHSVEFILEPRKIELVDNDITDSSSTHAVIIDGNSIQGTQVFIEGEPNEEPFGFRTIKVNMTAQGNYYVLAERDLRDEVDDQDLMFGRTWDIEYQGTNFQHIDANKIQVKPLEERYVLQYTGQSGNTQTLDVMSLFTGAKEFGNKEVGGTSILTEFGAGITLYTLDNHSVLIKVDTPDPNDYEHLKPTALYYQVNHNGTHLTLILPRENDHRYMFEGNAKYTAFTTYGAKATYLGGNNSLNRVVIIYPREQIDTFLYLTGKKLSFIGTRPGDVCLDSDLGKTYHIDGWVRPKDKPFTSFRDECVDLEYLKEYYCAEDGSAALEEHLCDDMCYRRKCIDFEDTPRILVSPDDNALLNEGDLTVTVSTPDEWSTCYYKAEFDNVFSEFVEIENQVGHRQYSFDLQNLQNGVHSIWIRCEGEEDNWNQEIVNYFVGFSDPDFSSIRSTIDYFIETFAHNLDITYLVVGDTAPSEDVIAVSDIAVGWQFATTDPSTCPNGVCRIQRIDVGATKLASEISDPTTVNLVSVGRPHNNQINNMYFPTTNYPIEENTAIIKVFPHDEVALLLLSGSDDEATRRAANVLANFEDYPLNNVLCVEVNTTDKDNLVLGACNFRDYPIPETRLVVTLNNPQTDDKIEGTTAQVEAVTNIDAVCEYWLRLETCFEDEGDDGEEDAGCNHITIANEQMEQTGGTTHTQILRNLELSSTYELKVSCEEGINNKDHDSATFYTIPKPTPRIFNITSPLEGISSERRQVLKFSTSILFEKITYRDNADRRSRERTLCRNCDSYGQDRRKYIPLRDGQHDLEFIGYLPNGSTYSEFVSILVDSRDPRITKSFPRSRSYSNGTFWVEYREDNPTHFAILHLNGKQYALFTPYENNQKGEGYIDLSEFDGQTIPFWIEVIDIAGNSDTTRTGTINVDVTSPEITKAEITPNGRRLSFDIEVSEKVTLEYYDNQESRPRWRTLCRNCDSYERTRTSRSDSIDMLFRATDKAGNTDTK